MNVTFTGSCIYLIGAGFVLGVCLFLCWVLPTVRRASLLSGSAFAPVGPGFEQLYMRDSWRPEFLLRFEIGSWCFGIEDCILAFAVAGIGAGVTELLHAWRTGAALPAITPRSVAWLLGAGVLGLALTWWLTDAGLVSQHAQIYSVVALWIAVVAVERPDWAASTLGGALVMAAVMALFYGAFFLQLFPNIIREWWLVDRCWGWFIGPLPVEEFAWAGASALYCGAALRFCLEKGARQREAAVALRGLAALADRRGESNPVPS